MVVGEVFAAARAAFWRWPILWLPPLMAQALQALAGGPYQDVGVQWLMLLMALGGSFLIQAGWVAMIVAALKGERPVLAFVEGVNRHWASFLVGNAAFFICVGAMAAAFVAYGEQQLGHAELKAYVDGFQGLDESALRARLKPEAVPKSVQAWANLVALWALSAGAFALLLSFWQPLAVAAELPWYRAWWRSLVMAFRQAPRLLGVGALHAASLLMALMALAGGGPVLGFVGVLALLSVIAFFKLVYAAWALKVLPGGLLAWPPPPEAQPDESQP